MVPRKKEFGEHVNDHQVDFCRQVSERMGTIFVVENVGELPDAVRRYDEIAASMKSEISNNNARFCMELGKIVDGMLQ